MSKHTPGPWTLTRTGDHKRWIVGNRQSTWGTEVAEVYSDDTDPDEAAANARLIATAPELLVELRAVSAWLKRLAIAPPNQMIGAALDEGVRRIDAAIAKAEGR